MNFEMPFIEYKSRGFLRCKNAITPQTLSFVANDIEFDMFDANSVVTGINGTYNSIDTMVSELLKNKINNIVGRSVSEVCAIDFIRNDHVHELLHRDSDTYPQCVDVVLIPLDVSGVCLKYAKYSNLYDNVDELYSMPMSVGDVIFHTIHTLYKIDITRQKYSYSFIKVTF
jgi:hypothetical protein